MILKVFLALSVFAISFYMYHSAKISFLPLNTKHEFTVFQDELGIPRVLGKDKLSLFYGIGYAQGADRLWTLNVKRRMVSGRLS